MMIILLLLFVKTAQEIHHVLLGPVQRPLVVYHDGARGIFLKQAPLFLQVLDVIPGRDPFAAAALLFQSLVTFVWK